MNWIWYERWPDGSAFMRVFNDHYYCKNAMQRSYEREQERWERATKQVERTMNAPSPRNNAISQWRKKCSACAPDRQIAQHLQNPFHFHLDECMIARACASNRNQVKEKEKKWETNGQSNNEKSAAEKKNIIKRQTDTTWRKHGMVNARKRYFYYYFNWDWHLKLFSDTL